MVAHFAAALFTGFMVYVAVPGSSLFSWHPPLMAFAMSMLMFEAIMVFSPNSSLIMSWTRQAKGNIHGYIMAVALCMAISGFTVIFYNKELYNKSHFVSWHGIFGLITVGWMVLQSTSGLFLKYYNLLKYLDIRLVEMKLYHATSGLCTFTLASLTLLLALYSDWFCSQVTGVTWYGCMALLSCMAMMVMQQVTQAYLPQTRIKVKPKENGKQNKTKENGKQNKKQKVKSR